MSEKLSLDHIADYYSSKIVSHGAIPEGVDWNGAESQIVRFDQLSKIIEDSGQSFSMGDLGCGYGAYYHYLTQRYGQNFQYIGYDISDEMIRSAQSEFESIQNAEFIQTDKPTKPLDYMTASGIFNVKLESDEKSWLGHILQTLNIMDCFSKKGFSFNCLTRYSDQDKMKDYLYYADPLYIFDVCKEKYARNVALLHDYDLYEFTILVRKS